MYCGRTVFTQIMDLIPRRYFANCIERYRGHYKVKTFSCQEQFRCMAFAQLTYRHSLRDVEVCLRALGPRLYHMGIKSRISKSTLADANENRDFRIYRDLAHYLMAKAKKMYSDEDFGFELDAALYALDSTVIDLCLTSFPWARFTRLHGAVKMHTLLNLKGNIPEFIRITTGNVSDYHGMDALVLEPGAFYVFDRGYYSFARLYLIHKAPAFFVTRAKAKFKTRCVDRRPFELDNDVMADHIVVIKAEYGQKRYPEPLRWIKYYDRTNHKVLRFLTNNFELPATTVAAIYKARWQIELFFRWIKQHLRIKNFFGRSENAVKTQIWIAVSSYVLVAILKKQLKQEHSMYKTLQVLSLALFEKVPVLELLRDLDKEPDPRENPNQLKLW